MSINLAAVRRCAFAMDYYPVIENDFQQERFFSEHPLEVFADPERVAKVQVMVGITEHEMFYPVPSKALIDEFWCAIILMNISNRCTCE
jgi:hypothetical protein